MEKTNIFDDPKRVIQMTKELTNGDWKMSGFWMPDWEPAADLLPPLAYEAQRTLLYALIGYLMEEVRVSPLDDDREDLLLDLIFRSIRRAGPDYASLDELFSRIDPKKHSFAKENYEIFCLLPEDAQLETLFSTAALVRDYRQWKETEAPNEPEVEISQTSDQETSNEPETETSQTSDQEESKEAFSFSNFLEDFLKEEDSMSSGMEKLFIEASKKRGMSIEDLKKTFTLRNWMDPSDLNSVEQFAKSIAGIVHDDLGSAFFVNSETGLLTSVIYYVAKEMPAKEQNLVSVFKVLYAEDWIVIGEALQNTPALKAFARFLTAEGRTKHHVCTSAILHLTQFFAENL